MVVSPRDDWTTPLEANVLSLPYRLSWIREDPPQSGARPVMRMPMRFFPTANCLRQRVKDKPAVFHRGTPGCALLSRNSMRFSIPWRGGKFSGCPKYRWENVTGWDSLPSIAARYPCVIVEA